MTWKTPAIIVVALVSISALIFHQNQNNVLGDSVVLLNPLADTSVSSSPSASIEPQVDSITIPITATPSPTVIAIPSAETATVSAKTTKKPIRPKPTPTPKPQPSYSSEQIYGFTEKYGSRYSIDPNVLRHIALCESGFNPMAKNRIYAGLYQFDINTWKNYRQKLGQDTDPDLRYNAEEAVETTAYALSLGASRLWPGCYPK